MIPTTYARKAETDEKEYNKASLLPAKVTCSSLDGTGVSYTIDEENPVISSMSLDDTSFLAREVSSLGKNIKKIAINNDGISLDNEKNEIGDLSTHKMSITQS